jgi:hypothetical protein
MKHKQFKISENTLFVYKSKRNLSYPTTDPTTSLMTTTNTSGIQFNILKKVVLL